MKRLLKIAASIVVCFAIIFSVAQTERRETELNRQ